MLSEEKAKDAACIISYEWRKDPISAWPTASIGGVV